MGEGDGVVVGCSGCGPVAVDTCTAEVHANERTGFVLYVFVCPSCGSYEVGRCADTSRRLLAGGARSYELRSTDAPPLTVDDLIDLHEWLESDPVWDDA
jgi:predicted RNA-binding Zn-ribbon protein involved in translation (DUF1610 family)